MDISFVAFSCLDFSIFARVMAALFLIKFLYDINSNTLCKMGEGEGRYRLPVIE